MSKFCMVLGVCLVLSVSWADSRPGGELVDAEYLDKHRGKHLDQYKRLLRSVARAKKEVRRKCRKGGGIHACLDAQGREDDLRRRLKAERLRMGQTKYWQDWYGIYCSEEGNVAACHRLRVEAFDTITGWRSN